MDTSSTFAVFGDSATTMLSALIFLATGTLAFAVMLGVRSREAPSFPRMTRRLREGGWPMT